MKRSDSQKSRSYFLKFIGCTLLVYAQVFGEELPHQPGKLFSRDEIAWIIQQELTEEDRVFLIDGSQLKGRIRRLPQVSFKAGQFPLKIEDALALAFTEVNGRYKMQVVTREGYSFVLEIPNERIQFTLTAPLDFTPRKELDPRTISYILFAEREPGEASRLSRFHTIELSNGDHIPAVITEEAIRLSNGWTDFSLRPDALVSVNFDGGIYGTVEGKNGEEDLEFAFVKDPILHIQVIKSPQTIGLSWSQILSITKEDPDPYKNVKSIEAARPPFPYLKEAASLSDEIAWIEETEDQEIAMVVPTVPLTRTQKRKGEVELTFWLELEMTRSQVLRRALHELANKWRELNDQNALLIKRLKKTDSEITRDLNEQIAHLTNSLEMAEEKALALSLEKRELAEDLKEEQAQLEEYRRQFERLNEQVVAKKMEIEKLQQDQGDLYAEIFRKMGELSIENELVETKQGQFQTALQEAQEERARLKKQLDSLTERTKDEIQRREEAFALKSEQLDILSQAHGLLQARWEEQCEADKQKEGKVMALKQAVESVKEENEMLKQLFEVTSQEHKGRAGEWELLKQEWNATAENFKSQLEEEKRRRDETTTHMENVLRLLEEEQEVNQQLQREVREREKALVEAQRAIGSLETNETDLQEQVALLATENQELRHQQEGLKSELQQTREESQTQKELITRLTESLNTQRSALNKIEQSHLNLVAELENARSMHTHLIKEISGETLSAKPAIKSVHIVAEGENLNNISMKYYNTPHRWTDIYEANRDVISNVNRIKAGTTLVIPE